MKKQQYSAFKLAYMYQFIDIIFILVFYADL